MANVDTRTPTPAAGADWLELRVGELRQLFNEMDPAPFRERDIDPNAETYIVEWAEETRADRRLGLVVHLARERATPESARMLRDSVDEYFRRRAVATRASLRRLFRIGLAFLMVALVVGETLSGMFSKESWGSLAKESFVIGGWVALWRPLEIFLYDWWPVRAEARLFDRLGELDVRLVGIDGTSAGTGTA
jgi:hypothetical protein